MGLSPFAKLVLWSGKVGSTVEILGLGFTTASSVAFGGAPASFTVVSDTYLKATVPANTATGSVHVATSAATLASSHIFLVVPVVKSFVPASGPVGTTVTITGTGLTGTTKVTFGSKGAAFSVNSNSQITATVPAGAKTAKISVLTAGGKASSPSSFTVTP